MPGAKRTTKSVSYTEDDDDGDFISKVDQTKKLRTMKTNDGQLESKSLTRQPPRKRNEKLSKSEQEELNLALQLSKATVPLNDVSIEIPVISDDKESTTSQSTVSSNESQTTVEKESDQEDENSSPKSKRMKREEEEEEEEEKEPTPRKKSDEMKKNSEIPTVTTIDLNSTRSTTRGQQKSSTSEPSNKKSNVPVGFPTSKIVISSLQTSRVGLSRKSSAIKSLHPNLNQRIVHE